MVAGPPDTTCEQQGWRFDWFGTTVAMLSTPGHTPGSVCVVIENCLFSGDTLLDNIRTPTNLPEGNAQLLKQSVSDLIERFPPDVRVYPGHGDSFPIGSVNLQAILGREP